MRSLKIGPYTDFMPFLPFILQAGYPGNEAVDVFTEDWSLHRFHALPPLNLVGRVLKKIENEKAEGILVVPCWPTQPWFSRFTSMCNDAVYILFNRKG